MRNINMENLVLFRQFLVNYIVFCDTLSRETWQIHLVMLDQWIKVRILSKSTSVLPGSLVGIVVRNFLQKQKWLKCPGSPIMCSSSRNIKPKGRSIILRVSVLCGYVGLNFLKEARLFLASFGLFGWFASSRKLTGVSFFR